MGGETIYVGKLSTRTRVEDLEDAFSRYGRIRRCQMKDGYAFIEYENYRDANDAIKDMDRRDFMGARILVEESKSGGRSSGAASSNTLYVGKLSSRSTTREVEDLFYKYGRITRCDLKSNYAFIEFEDSRDAEDAVRHADGQELNGVRITVEFAKSRARAGEGKCFNCGEVGHWARDCPRSRGNGGERRAPGPCFNCGEVGHLARDCPEPKRDRRDRSRSRSPRRKRRRSYSRSRSRSPAKRSRRRSRSRSISRSRSRSPVSTSRSPPYQSRSRSRSRSVERGRSRSPERRSRSRSRSGSRGKVSRSRSRSRSKPRSSSPPKSPQKDVEKAEEVVAEEPTEKKEKEDKE